MRIPTETLNQRKRRYCWTVYLGPIWVDHPIISTDIRAERAHDAIREATNRYSGTDWDVKRVMRKEDT